MDLLLLPAANYRLSDPWQPTRIARRRIEAAVRELRRDPRLKLAIIGGWRVQLKTGLISLAKVMAEHIKREAPVVRHQIALIDDSHNCTAVDLVAVEKAIRQLFPGRSRGEIRLGFVSSRGHFEKAKITLVSLGYRSVLWVNSGEPEAWSLKRRLWEQLSKLVTVLDPRWRHLGRLTAVFAYSRYQLCRIRLIRRSQTSV